MRKSVGRFACGKDEDWPEGATSLSKSKAKLSTSLGRGRRSGQTQLCTRQSDGLEHVWGCLSL